MGKISREELLRLMDESEENGGIDLDQLYSNAKQKLGDTDDENESAVSEGTFNKEVFAEVLEKARGARSVAEFGEAAGISAAHIARLLHRLITTPPSKETLEKIANVSANGVTFEILYNALKGNYNESDLNSNLFNERNRKLFAAILEQARGDRSVTVFASDAGMPINHLADLIEVKAMTAPSETSLKNIANVAQNDVTYANLIAAIVGDITDIRVAMINERLESTGKTSKEIVANSPLAQQSLKNIARNLDGILEQEGKPKATWEAFAEKDTTLDRYRNGDKTYHGIDTEAPTAMDCFGKSSKPKEIKDINSPEVLALIKKLKELGIREDDYAKTKLGLMSYREFLTNNPELLNFRRFKSVLKKIVGYVDISACAPKASKFLTTESLFFRVQGNSNVWNVWFHDVDTKQKRPFSKDYSIERYIDNAVEYIFTYGDSKFGQLADDLCITEQSRRFLFYIVYGLMFLGYNAKQILFALCRVTEPERNWKMKPIRDYHKFTQEPNYYTDLCTGMLIELSSTNITLPDGFKSTVVDLLDLIKEPSENLLNSSFESLMIKDIDSLRKELRKRRIKDDIKYTFNWVVNMHPDAINCGRYKTKEKFDKAFQEYLGYFKESEPDVCNNLELAYNKGDYFEAIRHLEQLEYLDNSNKYALHEKVNAATQQLPGKKLFTPGESEEKNNRGEIERICWEFRFGKPY